MLQRRGVISFEETEKLLKDYVRTRNRLAELEAMEIPEYPHDGEQEEGDDATQALCKRIISFYSKGEKTRQRAISELRFLVTKIERLVSYLPSKYKEIIELIYFEGQTYDQATDKLYIARSTLNKRRKEAIMEICKMI